MVRRQLDGQTLPFRHLGEILMWLLGHRRRLRISGDSMLPHLSDGDVVLVDDLAYDQSPPQIGHVVVAKHPYIRDYLMVKRVAEVTPSGTYFLRGDNPRESTDSSSFGAIRYDRIVARVTSRL